MFCIFSSSLVKIKSDVYHEHYIASVSRTDFDENYVRAVGRVIPRNAMRKKK